MSLRFLIIPLLCLSTLLQAQGYDTDKYGPYSQFRFSLMPALYNKLDYENEGVELFKTSVGVGGEIVIYYGHSIWKGFGINVGAGVAFVPYNFSFDLVTDSSSIIAGNPGTLGQTPHRSAKILWTFPIMIEKKFLLFSDDGIFLNLEAGVKWNIKTAGNANFGGAYFAQTEDGEDVRYFEYRFMNVGENEFISYAFKAGLMKVNKRGNTINWNLVFHRSPARLMTGTYQFNELGFESSGTTDLYNNYIGIEMIFGLSLDKKSNHY